MTPTCAGFSEVKNVVEQLQCQYIYPRQYVNQRSVSHQESAIVVCSSDSVWLRYLLLLTTSVESAMLQQTSELPTYRVGKWTGWQAGGWAAIRAGRRADRRSSGLAAGRARAGGWGFRRQASENVPICEHSSKARNPQGINAWYSTWKTFQTQKCKKHADTSKTD